MSSQEACCACKQEPSPPSTAPSIASTTAPTKSLTCIDNPKYSYRGEFDCDVYSAIPSLCEWNKDYINPLTGMSSQEVCCACEKVTLSPSPTSAPTTSPTHVPTASPTNTPTASPTFVPSQGPTLVPTASPTLAPTIAPSKSPSVAPTESPTILCIDNQEFLAHYYYGCDSYTQNPVWCESDKYCFDYETGLTVKEACCACRNVSL
mmetsp:Transcript_8824/g.11092  ORF Transcript_8824/g.11092 Transcript_8824/m.11092 type:complete len:206 (-) Transcript_8824:48-665(-)